VVRRCGSADQRLEHDSTIVVVAAVVANVEEDTPGEMLVLPKVHDDTGREWLGLDRLGLLKVLLGALGLSLVRLGLPRKLESAHRLFGCLLPFVAG
jgi:hypothetical protein